MISLTCFFASIANCLLKKKKDGFNLFWLQTAPIFWTVFLRQTTESKMVTFKRKKVQKGIVLLLFGFFFVCFFPPNSAEPEISLKHQSVETFWSLNCQQRSLQSYFVAHQINTIPSRLAHLDPMTKRDTQNLREIDKNTNFKQLP